MKLILVLLFPFILNAQTFVKESKEIESFVPEGWLLISSAKGDINKDNLEDACCIIQKKMEKDAQFAPRTLLILLKTNHNSYKLDLVSTTAIEARDSFDKESSVEIANGVVKVGINLIRNGATNWTYIFRYQNNDWYLVGVTLESGNAEFLLKHDFNLSTGKLIVYEKFDNDPKKNLNLVLFHKMKILPKLRNPDLSLLEFKIKGREYSF
jgi:hypothetical protein